MKNICRKSNDYCDKNKLYPQKIPFRIQTTGFGIQFKKVIDGTCTFVENQKSKIKNRKSKIENQKSKITCASHLCPLGTKCKQKCKML